MKPSNLKTIYVDDNEINRRKVAQIIQTTDDMEYAGGFGSVEAAMEWLSGNKADIVLLNSELQGKDCLWPAKILSSFGAGIAFQTAHPRYAVAAFEIFAIHYLVNPVTSLLVETTINRLRLMYGNNMAMQVNQIQSLTSNNINTDCPSRIFLKSLQETLIVELDKVMYFSARRSCTQFEMSTGEKITASKNIKVYCDYTANNPNFIRIHRSHVVNKNYIRAITQKGHTPQLVMKNGVCLEVSYFRKNAIIETLEK